MHTNPARGVVILVADDVIGNIRLLKNALQDLATVVFAQDGVEALLQTERHHPDLILLDVLMPKLDGFETCRRLKANPATKGIPVIFITAADAETDETAGLTVGAIDYIAKPFAPAIVRARVQNQLALVRATAALHSTNDALRKFKAAVDCSRSAIIITDRDAKVEYVNAAFSRMSGFAAADVVGRAPALLSPPESTASSEALTRAFKKGSDWRGELQTKRQDGSLTWQDIAVAPVTDHTGLITHFVAIAADIDQQKGRRLVQVNGATPRVDDILSCHGVATGKLGIGIQLEGKHRHVTLFGHFPGFG